MKKTIVALITLLWLAGMTWLIRYEAFPHLFTGTLQANYGTLLADGPMLSDAWMKIIMQGVHAGYSHTSVEMDERDPNRRYQVRNTTDMNLNVLDRVQPVFIRVFCELDALYKLQYFEFTMKSARYSIALNARRIQHDTFRVKMNSPAGVQTFEVELPPDVVIYSPAMMISLRGLKPGQTMTMTTVDPATLTPKPVVVRALRHETIQWRGQPRETLVLSYTYGGGEMTSWLDTGSGEVIRQETPWGWTLEASAAAEALAYDRRGVAQVDQAAQLAVAVDRPIANPRLARRLHVRFDGAGMTAFDLESDRQQVLEKGEDYVVLATRSDSLDAAPSPGPGSETPDMLAPYLAPTIYVQADHPRIRDAAERILRGVETPVERARALNRWVFNEVRKEPTASLPSALDVLTMMSGDCNEHTYLYTALARAAGIPTRIQIGLVYMHDAFYYHAWPAVYLDRWIDLDPTFGTDGVDATHIVLLEGELAEQLQLLRILGQVRAQILEVSHDDDPNREAH